MKKFYSFSFALFFAMSLLVERCIVESQRQRTEMMDPQPDINEYLPNAKKFLPILKAGELAPVLRTIEDTDFAVSYVELQMQSASAILNTYPVPPDSLITAEFIPERGYIDYHFYFIKPEDKTQTAAEINVLVTYNRRSKGKVSMFGANKYRIIPHRKDENAQEASKTVRPI
jgi:hypothetical protein